MDPRYYLKFGSGKIPDSYFRVRLGGYDRWDPTAGKWVAVSKAIGDFYSRATEDGDAVRLTDAEALHLVTGPSHRRHT